MRIGCFGVADLDKVIGRRIDGGFDLIELGFKLLEVGGIDLMVDLVEDVGDEDMLIFVFEFVELRNFFLQRFFHLKFIVIHLLVHVLLPFGHAS